MPLENCKDHPRRMNGPVGTLVARTVMDAIDRLVGRVGVDPTETFEALSLDNLDLIELLIDIEDAFDISLDDEAFAATLTPAEVIALVSQQVRTTI